MLMPAPATLLPHTGRAMLIDAVVDDADSGFAAVAEITAAHPFHVPGKGVPAWVGIELMAQAIAVHAGLGAHDQSQGPRRGMLLGTRRYQSQVAWFAEGTRLLVRTDREFKHEGGIAACQCRIDSEGRTVAEATIIILEETDA